MPNMLWIPVLASLLALELDTEKAMSEQPFRIAVIGLTHGHVESLLSENNQRDDITIVGIWEPNHALFDRLSQKYGIANDLRHTDLTQMLRRTKPGAAVVMTSTRAHLDAVRACAPLGIDMIVEKPLAASLDDAQQMAALAKKHSIELLTNYETSWYASNHQAHRMTRQEGKYQPIRRVVFRHGHSGPAEIGVAPEFLNWLIDPEENGAGALFDFGCYGANLMTWLKDGGKPQTVSATLRSLKPDRYPRVDDDATIVLGYVDSVAVIQASWCWTHDNKEMTIYTDAGSLHAGRWNELTTRDPNRPARKINPVALKKPYDNPWSYLRAVVRKEANIEPLSSLKNNLVVMEILEAARQSHETGKIVHLYTTAKVP